MNLLDKTDLSFDNNKNEIIRKKIVNTEKKNIQKSKKEPSKFFMNKNDIYKNIIILFLIFFGIFITFVIKERSNEFLNVNYSFIKVFDKVLDSKHFIMHYMRIRNNKMNIVINAKKEDYIYNELTGFENLFKNIKLNIDNSSSQIWIEEDSYVSKNVNLNAIYSLIDNIDNLDVELEIINNTLVVVGELNDFQKIFNYLKIINYNNFEFDLRLIEHDKKYKYYKLTIE